jgi:hypothetical protein
MIWINMFFNLVLTATSLIGYFSSNPLFYVNLAKYTSATYFIEDSLMEVILYKRYIYLPHHIISLVAIFSMWNSFPLYDSLLMFFITESSAIITNLRGVLKKRKSLPIHYDKLFFSYYMVTRNIAMPIMIYRYSNYTIIYYSGGLIQLMSLYWSYKWGKSIVEYQKKD